MGFYHEPERRAYRDDEFVLIRPRVCDQRCQPYIFVLHDDSRVFVGRASGWGFEGVAREADDVEIEALAERFNLERLRRVLKLRRRPPGEAGAG